MKAMNSDPNKRYPTADAMLADLEKFRKDPSVDMDYIRRELDTPSSESEPTMPLPTSQVASAVKKRSAEARRDDYRDDEPPRRDKKSLAIIVGIFAAALVLVLVQSAVLVHVRIWGVHPFILPAIAVIPATLERGEQGLLYGAFFGLACRQQQELPCPRCAGQDRGGSPAHG